MVTALFGRTAQETFPRPGRFSSHNGFAGLPQIMLWAWERRENLDFIDPRGMGVAFLAGTLYLRGERVVVRPRLQPLRVPAGATLMAVIRLESDQVEPPQLSTGQQKQVVAAITKLTRTPKVTAIQIDFDAKASERAFYPSCAISSRHPSASP